MMILRLSSVLIVAQLAALGIPSVVAESTMPKPVLFHHVGSRATVSNGFVEIVVDLSTHSVVELHADHTGSGSFGVNLLAERGICFDGSCAREGTVGASWKPVQIDTRERTKSIRFRMDPASSGANRSAELTLSLTPTGRGADVSVLLPKVRTKEDVSPGVRIHLPQFMLVGIFSRGTVQYIAGQKQSFASLDPLRLFYTIDRTNGSVAIVPSATIPETALLSGSDAFASGIELHAVPSNVIHDSWQPATAEQPSGSSTAGGGIIAFKLYANDLPFPTHLAERSVISAGDPQNRDSTAYLSATYGSAAAVVGSYQDPGSAYPTLAVPKRSYEDTFNYFDPDAWPTVTTLAYSGDPLLQHEARMIIERSEQGMLADGQIPHHFKAGKPVYVSLAKSKQTGPNLFWVLAAIEYAAGSGDEAWLRIHYSHLQRATDWILSRFDPTHSLLYADGPLFIDVFRRSGYTLDTNAVALDLLDRMADAATFCNDPASADRYRAMSANLKIGLRRELWDGTDHFITQRNPDGSTRDFVDYDGNFAALANGVLDKPSDQMQLLKRLDSGPHVHPGGRGTWVSEKLYGTADCYNGNTGDSDVAMGRIWWFDMLTRVRFARLHTFNDLLGSMEGDLLQNVWMSERYDAAGRPAHNGYYHEYPEIISMVLRELRYGIHVGLSEVSVRPFGVDAYQFHMGQLQVEYARDKVVLRVPGSSMRRFTVSGLFPKAKYVLSTGKKLLADRNGTLQFTAPAGLTIRIAEVAGSPRAARE